MPRPRSDLREQLLLAARKLFLRHGVDAVSLRAIAQEGKSSLGMINYYFHSKDELFMAVVEVHYAILLSELEAALAPGRPFAERVRALFARLGRLEATEVDTLRLVLGEMLGNEERRALLFQRFTRGHVPLLVQLMADGHNEGAVRADLPLIGLMGATMALGAVPPLFHQFAASMGIPPAVIGAGPRPEVLVDVLLKGFAPAAVPGREATPVQSEGFAGAQAFFQLVEQGAQGAKPPTQEGPTPRSREEPTEGHHAHRGAQRR